MKRRFTEEQIIAVLREQEAGRQGSGRRPHHRQSAVESRRESADSPPWQGLPERLFALCSYHARTPLSSTYWGPGAKGISLL